MVVLISTGIVEWCIFLNINYYSAEINTKSEMISWIKENTKTDDVFLTPMWALNRFFLAGRPAFYGWPYYAWSAGHDTDKRGNLYGDLLRGCYGDKDEFVRICRENNIHYVVVDPEMYDLEREGITFNEAFFQNNFTEVASFPDENTKIYKVY